MVGLYVLPPAILAVSGRGPTSSVGFVTESVKVYKVRQDGFANFIVIKR